MIPEQIAFRYNPTLAELVGILDEAPGTEALGLGYWNNETVRDAAQRCGLRVSENRVIFHEDKYPANVR